ncbi:MAG: DUF2281 domain-containing protein [Candidatus Aminicenantes bacterium]|nr:DUF2281 domain-containing protein [Candidatus Aminicenantes bacterium]
MGNTSIYTKFNALSDSLKGQVMNFIDSLAEKKSKKIKGNKQKTPKFGSCRGMFEMTPDFDEPLEDFQELPFSRG